MSKIAKLACAYCGEQTTVVLRRGEEFYVCDPCDTKLDQAVNAEVLEALRLRAASQKALAKKPPMRQVAAARSERQGNKR